jgi:hypothetical protein
MQKLKIKISVEKNLNLVKFPTYKAGLQNNIFINDNSICIPLFGKEWLGDIFKEIIRKIPLNPPFSKGET